MESAPPDSAPPGKPPSASPPAGNPAFRPLPDSGRVFATARTVRSTDVTPDGRLRLDAVARYLQEAAEDDLAEAGWQEPYDWLLRRCAVAVRAFPRYRDQVRLSTFCSATGPRWAERTTTLAGRDGDLIQGTAVWVATERGTGRPRPLGPEFHRLYGAAAAGRSVTARLFHPPPDGTPASQAWPLRASDFDPAGHVNNTVHWAVVEDVLAGAGWLPASAEVEYHRQIRPGQRPRLATSGTGGELRLWLLAGRQRLASAYLAR